MRSRRDGQQTSGQRRPTSASPELASAEERQPVAALLAGLELIVERAVVLRTDGLAREDARLGVGREEPEIRPEEDLWVEGAQDVSLRHSRKDTRCETDLEDPADDVEHAAVGGPHLGDLREVEAVLLLVVEAVKDSVKLAQLEVAVLVVRLSECQNLGPGSRSGEAEKAHLVVRAGIAAEQRRVSSETPPTRVAREVANAPAMLGACDAADVDREQEVGHPRLLRRVADVQDVEGRGRHHGDDSVEAERAKTGVSVRRVAGSERKGSAAGRGQS